jgi:hypothetical protein
MKVKILLTKDNKKMNKVCIILDRKLNEFDKDNKELIEEVKYQRNENTQKNRESEILKNEIKNKNTELKEKIKEIENKNLEIESLIKVEIENLKNELEETILECKNLTNHNIEILQQIKLKDEESMELNDILNQRNIEIDELKLSIKLKNEDYQSMERIQGNNDQLIKNYINEINEMNFKFMNIKNEFDSIMNEKNILLKG